MHISTIKTMTEAHNARWRASIAIPSIWATTLMLNIKIMDMFSHVNCTFPIIVKHKEQSSLNQQHTYLHDRGEKNHFFNIHLHPLQNALQTIVMRKQVSSSPNAF